MSTSKRKDPQLKNAGKVAAIHKQPHGRSNFDQDAGQAGRHTRDLNKIQKQIEQTQDLDCEE